MPFNNKSGDDHNCLWGFALMQVLLSQELMLDFIWKGEKRTWSQKIC